MSFLRRIYAKAVIKGAAIRLSLVVRVRLWRLAKRLEAVRQKSQGATLQACILDTSGSMFQSLGVADLICSVVSKNAKRHGDEVALLTCTDAGKIQLLAAPSRNYDEMKEHTKALTAAGATLLAPAFSWLNNYCSTTHLSPMGIIVTDAFTFDEAEILRELQRTRERLHGSAMLITPVADNEMWTRLATKEGTLEVFQAESLIQAATQMRSKS